MSKGYQIIEPDTLVGLFADPKYFELSVALFTWLIERLREDLKEQLVPAELDIIRVEYCGAYPAIGIHYHDRNPNDLGPLVESTIAKLMSERPVLEFVSFVARSKLDWREVTDKLMKSQGE
jgi:hypothetical protein